MRIRAYSMHPKPPDEGPEFTPEPPGEGAEEGAARALQRTGEDDDEQAIEQIAQLLPPEKRVELLQVIESHKGWLPPPSMLAHYESVLPGLAERIVALPEREQAHRHRYLEEESGREFKLRRRGQDYALVGMCLILGFAVFLALVGQAEWAARLVIGTLVGIVGIFITGKWLDAKAAKEDDSE